MADIPTCWGEGVCGDCNRHVLVRAVMAPRPWGGFWLVLRCERCAPETEVVRG